MGFQVFPTDLLRNLFDSQVPPESCTIATAALRVSETFYGNRDALGFELPPDLASFRHIPVHQACFPVHSSHLFREAAPEDSPLGQAVELQSASAALLSQPPGEDSWEGAFGGGGTWSLDGIVTG